VHDDDEWWDTDYPEFDDDQIHAYMEEQIQYSMPPENKENTVAMHLDPGVLGFLSELEKYCWKDTKTVQELYGLEDTGRHVVAVDPRHPAEVQSFMIAPDGMIYQTNPYSGRIIRHQNPPLQSITPTMMKEEEMDLESRKASLQAQLDRLTDRLIRLERFPTQDPCSDTDVIRFDKAWRPGAEQYSYAAIRIGGYYYLTGANTKPLTWDQLVHWMGEEVTEVWVMELHKQIVPHTENERNFAKKLLADEEAAPQVFTGRFNKDGSVETMSEREYWAEKQKFADGTTGAEDERAPYAPVPEHTPKNLETKTGDYFSYRPIKDDPQA